MAESYQHTPTESKWATRWRAADLYKAHDFSEKPKKYLLVEFPYPSGTGLHCGHVYRFTLPDIYARKLRMDGHNVLFPIGWDAFGLPAENYAVKTGVHPAITTKQAIETFTRQMTALGFSFDWSREISTIDQEYYKWTQWIFLRFFERGLAELVEQPVWWCDALRTVLANEEVLDDGQGGKISERGSHPVEKRMLKQWVLKLPHYADKLLEGLNEVEFPESVRSAQQNWIGRSVGAQIKFPLSAAGNVVEVFTTRPDTILGVTFMVVAPEHPLLDKLRGSITNWEEIERYKQSTANRSDLERKAAKEKSGVKIAGLTAINPINAGGASIPIFVADYVLMEYGTGAIMGVPAHDARDFEFATKFGLDIVQTVYSTAVKEEQRGSPDVLPLVSDHGTVVIPSGVSKLWELSTVKAKNGQVTTTEMTEAVIQLLQASGEGQPRVTFRIRDWLFSRQRYWGEPIPLVHCDDGSIEPIVATTDIAGVKTKLPLVLPEVPDYLPSADGYSPLGKNKEWLTTVDARGNHALRETNTMPNWAGSCWYYLRYIDPHNHDAFADPEKLKYWLPVDRYFGGSEHTTLHLLYSRFWHRFLYDEGLVPTPEPYAWRMNGGVLLGPDSQRMSKSRGNVVNPDEKVDLYGADALRLYVSFMGPYDGTLPWAETGLKACRKLVDRIWHLQDKVQKAATPPELERAFHKLVKRVGSMIDNLKSNTSVSEIMVFTRALEGAEVIPTEIWKGFLKVIAPFAVFIAEELWQLQHGANGPATDQWNPETSVHLQPWPTYDESLARDELLKIGIQVNGKLRDEVEVTPEEEEGSVREKVFALPGVQRWVGEMTVKKFVYVKGRIVSIVAV